MEPLSATTQIFFEVDIRQSAKVKFIFRLLLGDNLNRLLRLFSGRLKFL